MSAGEAEQQWQSGSDTGAETDPLSNYSPSLSPSFAPNPVAGGPPSPASSTATGEGSESSLDWYTQLFGRPEPDVYAEAQAMFRLDRAAHTLTGPNGEVYGCGEFATPSLGDLRAEALDRRGACTPGRVVVTHIATWDVLELHALPDSRGALFQAASQFNCLEFPSSGCVPEQGVTNYCYDNTQGPACAIAAGPGTVLRNYFAEMGGRVGQTRDCQINNLEGLEALVDNATHGFWAIRNGYTFSSKKGMAAFGRCLAATTAMDPLRDAIRIGVHADVEVTFSERCPRRGNVRVPRSQGQSVTQAYCSAVSCSYSSVPTQAFEPLARLVLEAAYEATLCAAVTNAARTGNHRVFLTSLGGGVFGNDSAWIGDAIGRALAKADAFGVALQVFVVHFRSVDKAYARRITTHMAQCLGVARGDLVSRFRADAATAATAHSPGSPAREDEASSVPPSLSTMSTLVDSQSSTYTD